jgi:hypothetical protein
MDSIKDIFGFLRERKKFWLAPAIVTLLLVGAIIFLGASTAASPFIYTVF